MSNTAVVDVLRDVGTTCRDSAEGYRKSAEATSDSELRSMLEELARRREEQVNEIDGCLARLGASPVPREGSTSGALHRSFVKMKAALSRDDREAVIEEIVRGESYAEAAYDQALKSDLPFDMRQIIARQHDSVRESRDRFRAMERSHMGRSTTGGFAGQVAESSRRSLRQAEHYVAERPLASTLMAVGVGFLLGALLTMSTRGRHPH